MPAIIGNKNTGMKLQQYSRKIGVISIHHIVKTGGTKGTSTIRCRATPTSRLLSPSLGDFSSSSSWSFLFAASTGGWQQLLADSDTGWHIRNGQWILEHHTVPHTDLFSFSKPGAPWFAWEWLADVIFAAAHLQKG